MTMPLSIPGVENEAQAFVVLDTLNEHVAGMFCKPVQPVRFVFLTLIYGPRKKTETWGMCVMSNTINEIQLKAREGWPRTAIHELAHLYDPNASEKTIKALTIQCVQILKLRGIEI